MLQKICPYIHFRTDCIFYKKSTIFTQGKIVIPFWGEFVHIFGTCSPIRDNCESCPKFTPIFGYLHKHLCWQFIESVWISVCVGNSLILSQFYQNSPQLASIRSKWSSMILYGCEIRYIRNVFKECL